MTTISAFAMYFIMILLVALFAAFIVSCPWCARDMYLEPGLRCSSHGILLVPFTIIGDFIDTLGVIVNSTLLISMCVMTYLWL